MLDSGPLPSTLKVYVATITSFRSRQGEQSVSRHALVVSFLKEARRLHPPRPPSVPPWDLEVVLRTLSQPPFEPLTSVDLNELSLKTALLLALASAKRIGDLHAFSVDSSCIRFGPGDCSVTLRLKLGYVPKSRSTPFRTQTVSLSALSSKSSALRDADAQTSVCPIRALRTYIDRRSAFGNLTSFSITTVVVRRARPCQNRKCPTGLWTLSRLLIRAKVWNAPCTLGVTQQGLLPPPGHGQEVCLIRIYDWQRAGLLRIPSPDCTSLTFRP